MAIFSKSISTYGVFDYKIRIWIHIESLWQADLTFIRYLTFIRK